METTDKNLSRRNFIKLSSLSSVALTLGFYFPAKGKEAEIIKPEAAENLGIDLNALDLNRHPGKGNDHQPSF